MVHSRHFLKLSPEAPHVWKRCQCKQGKRGGWLSAKSRIYKLDAFLSTNLMVRVSTPILLLFFILNGWRYHMLRDPMDLALLGTWILLLLILAAYYLLDNLDITQKLWARGEGIWFSQNDVLHIGLILWVIYLATVVANRVKDYTGPVLPE